MSPVIRTALAAAETARKYTTYKVAYCLNFVWACLGYPNTGKSLPHAKSAWEQATQKVTDGSTPPVGAPVYWRVGQYWHIAVSLGGGLCRSTDVPSKGKVGTIKIADLSKSWGATYLGWSRDYAGVPIPGLEKPTPKPTPPPTSSKKSNEQIAAEVWAGKWGSGNDRTQKLKAAGYNPATIQMLVNRGVGKNPASAQPPSKKTITQVAKEVIAGLWGNGPERVRKLQVSGYNATTVQNEVNRLLR